MDHHEETSLSTHRESSERPTSPEPDASIPPAAAQKAASASVSPSWIPDWAPWTVLGGLTCLGLLGGLGFVPLRLAKAKSASAVVSAQPAAATNSTLASRPAPAPAQPVPGSRDQPKSWAEAKAGPKISVLELVVAYKGTALGAHQNVQRTQEQARARALEALARARKGEDFAKLIDEYSDEPSTNPRRGHIEGFARGQAIPSFADAAFALKPGELSVPVLTPFGYHIILRTK
jgi:PPIC-type PPIASE domain